MIFDLAMEPLECQLRLRARNWGIELLGEHHVVSLYADDALIYLRGPHRSVPDLMSILDGFGAISGLKVNWTKSFIYRLRYIAPLMRTPRLPAQL